MNGLCRIGINLVAVAALAAGTVTAQGQDQELASEISDVLLFDTSTALAGELPSAALAEKAGWVKVEEGAAPGQLNGDLVLLNGRIAVVLRKSAAGAEVYSHSVKGWQRRALLAPAKAEKAARLRAVKILASGPDTASVEGVFESPGGQSLGLRYGLARGQIFVETTPGGGTNRVRIEAPSRFGVIPDFFADDIVIDAARLPLDRAEIPTENMFLQMLGRTEAVVMAVWDKEQRDITVTLSGRENDRLLTAVEVPCATNGKVCVAVMDYPGACCASAIDGLADPEVPIWAQTLLDVRALGWTMPYPAQWRVDFAPQKGGMARSSEMVAPYPASGAGGVMKSPRDVQWKFIKPKYRWLSEGEKAEDRARRFEAAQAFRQTGGEELPASLGTCWVDEKGNGFIRPKNEEYAVVAYPLDRGRGTPLAAFTVTDLVRATLGVGPCEYILDVKGQRLATPGVYTCAGTALLKKIMEDYDEAKHKAEIDKVFNDMLIFVRRYRGRVEEYIAFRKEMLDYLKQQKAAHPELETFISDMEKITSGLPSRIEKDVPDRVARLADEFRATLPSRDEAAKKAREQINADIRGAGGYQDGIVNGCHKTLNMLRYLAGIEATSNPKAVGVAQEIRLRARKILRNPVAHEFDEGRPW
ncbi:MAG: hypothetical protein ACOX1P_10540 [Thermoguttaceae bacterium]